MKRSYFSKKSTVNGCIHKNLPAYILRVTFTLYSPPAHASIISSLISVWDFGLSN